MVILNKPYSKADKYENEMLFLTKADQNPYSVKNIIDSCTELKQHRIISIASYEIHNHVLIILLTATHNMESTSYI